mmetsp:Transcript_101999/g.285938  ORF Transcript_101999/g.285938 Transcript_101999/m.285938 type:complete len:217 (+) Transcript_101999:68-718(+)
MLPRTPHLPESNTGGASESAATAGDLPHSARWAQFDSTGEGEGEGEALYREAVASAAAAALDSYKRSNTGLAHHLSAPTCHVLIFCRSSKTSKRPSKSSSAAGGLSPPSSANAQRSSNLGSLTFNSGRYGISGKSFSSRGLHNLSNTSTRSQSALGRGAGFGAPSDGFAPSSSASSSASATSGEASPGGISVLPSAWPSELPASDSLSTGRLAPAE